MLNEKLFVPFFSSLLLTRAHAAVLGHANLWNSFDSSARKSFACNFIYPIFLLYVWVCLHACAYFFFVLFDLNFHFLQELCVKSMSAEVIRVRHSMCSHFSKRFSMNTMTCMTSTKCRMKNSTKLLNIFLFRFNSRRSTRALALWNDRANKWNACNWCVRTKNVFSSMDECAEAKQVKEKAFVSSSVRALDSTSDICAQIQWKRTMQKTMGKMLTLSSIEWEKMNRQRWCRCHQPLLIPLQMLHLSENSVFSLPAANKPMRDNGKMCVCIASHTNVAHIRHVFTAQHPNRNSTECTPSHDQSHYINTSNLTCKLTKFLQANIIAVAACMLNEILTRTNKVNQQKTSFARSLASSNVKTASCDQFS